MKVEKPGTTASPWSSLGTADCRSTPEGRNTKNSPTSRAVSAAKANRIQRQPRVMRFPPASRFASRRQQRQQTLERFEVVGRQQPIDMGKRRGHSAGCRLVARVRKQRIQPENPPRAGMDRLHGLLEDGRVAAVQAV